DYEYIDVIVEDDRLIIDIDFRSEFEIARSTKNYRTILQSLPSIFVGKPDRLQQIVSIVSEAAT
ncbi:Translation initiation factor if-2 like, partial [Thalictrum thalictroides]